MSLDIETKENTVQNTQIEELFDNGAHVAYTRSKRHPSVKDFLFGKKQKNDIIDLIKTVESLTQVEKLVKELAEAGKTVLFVGTKHEARSVIEKYATEVNMPFVTFRWIGGLLTNFQEVKKRIDRLAELKQLKDSEDFSKYTKKEQGVMTKELNNLLRKFGGVQHLSGVPHAIFVVDSRHEDIAVLEAQKINIPVIGLCGSDCDITKVTYPIVANDSSVLSITYFTSKIAQAIGGKTTSL